MKKILSIGLLFICLLTFVGCKHSDEDIQTGLSSQMILLEQYDDYSGLCYDKDTKIIYLYNRSYSCYYSYSVYYVMDTNNNPIIGVYYE